MPQLRTTPPIHAIKPSFSGGEFAPSLYSRVDISKYATGLRNNCRPSRIVWSAHCPPCLQVKAGDEVKLVECRPLSKTVAFVIVEKR